MNVINEVKHPIKMWTGDMKVEEAALAQLLNIANMPFIYKHVAVMPDVHLGKGATVGSVVPTENAIIPAAVGVDIGCGMAAVKTTMHANNLPDNLHEIRHRIEQAVPHGRTNNGGAGDRGAWGEVPMDIQFTWEGLSRGKHGYELLTEKYNNVLNRNAHPESHLGTLGTGNHFIELCLDEEGWVWVMLHSGSRGIGNRIGTHFIDAAKKKMDQYFIALADKDLAYLVPGEQLFTDYINLVQWAQQFAASSRELMMDRTLAAAGLRPTAEAVYCHHNYIASERHFGKTIWVTRKGAVNAELGKLGIIPGSMGQKSYIVRGKGNADSFNSCSHGAGRAMSRTEAKRRFTKEDLAAQTEGVECRKDDGVVDEIPSAYKDLDLVMTAQDDLVEIVHTLKAILTVKG